MNNELSCLERFASIPEQIIARKLVRAILDRGYTISVHDGEEFNSQDQNTLYRVCSNLASTSDDRIYFRKDTDRGYAGWFWLIWGNGEDLISDYVANDTCDEIIAAIA